MRYFGFEAGSRAGLSTELFFADYKKHVSSDDSLKLSDKDFFYSKVKSPYSFVERCTDKQAMREITANDCIFPCDELTRQSNRQIGEIASGKMYSNIDRMFYDKRKVNSLLSSIAKGLLIPKTFQVEEVFVKPNSMSAGSKGCKRKCGLCVSEYIHIKKEYVVDCLKWNSVISIFPRQVILKNGYDKYIKLIPAASNVGDKTIEFIESVDGYGLFDGIFHIQVAEDYQGRLFYIEASKRISGSSIVNLERGYNPFFSINRKKREAEQKFEELQWYRFEDFIYGKV